MHHDTTGDGRPASSMRMDAQRRTYGALARHCGQTALIQRADGWTCAIIRPAGHFQYTLSQRSGGLAIRISALPFSKVSRRMPLLPLAKTLIRSASLSQAQTRDPVNHQLCTACIAT